MKIPAFFLAILLAFPAFLKAEDAPPNIVLILSDDQAWTDYSFMGHEHIETPHLDKLAEESAVFTRGYVPTGLCRPSLMTLATGLYVHQHQTSGNDPTPLKGTAKAAPKKPKGAAGKAKGKNKGKAAAPSPEQIAVNKKYKGLQEQLISHVDKHPTIAELLATKGYLSHQSGKWWEGSYKRGGFTHGMTRGFPEPGGRHGDDGLKIGREGLAEVTDFIDMAVEKEKPFYLWYAPFLPHTPHNPPKRLFDKYKGKGIDSDFVARYYAMCEWFDETCGELKAHIDSKGITENTLIIYICDNGWIQSEDNGKYAPRSKQTAYEGGVRQPTMYSWPGTIKKGDRGKELGSSIDIVPTMLAAAGVEIPKEMPGINLLPILKSGDHTPRDIVFGESCAHDIGDVDNHEDTLLFRWAVEGKWKLLLTYDGVVNRYKSTHPRDEKRPQLFDLLADPHEKVNLAKDNPEVVADLAKKIGEWYPVKERKVITEWVD